MLIISWLIFIQLILLEKNEASLRYTIIMFISENEKNASDLTDALIQIS